MIIGNRSAYETVIKDLTIQSNDKILEIGYEPGVGINLISKRFYACDIYGIDYSEKALKTHFSLKLTRKRFQCK
jgi:trans-aconitate methyltransferase